MSWASAVRQTKSSPTKAAPPPQFSGRPKFDREVIDWARLVSLDFETFYDADYTLSKLSTSEYIRDPRFEALMMGVKVGRGKRKVIPGPKIAAFLKTIDWKTHSLLCHNTQFDGFVLSHHYKVVPKRYYCSLSMARGLHSNEIGAGLEEVSIHYGRGGKLKGALESMKGKRYKDLVREGIYAVGAEYCGVDVDEMYEVFKCMVEQMPRDEMDLIHMTCRMFCDPVLKVDIPRVEAELKREMDRRRKLLTSLIDTTLYADDVKLTRAEKEAAPEGSEERVMLITKKVVGSSEKFADLLRHEGVEPPLKISPAWMKKPAAERSDDDKYTYAFAKDDLEFVNLPDDVESLAAGLNLNKKADVKRLAERQARLRALVDTRLAVKSTTNVTRAQRFLVAGANGMPLPVGYSYYRAHCVPGSTEVLTRDGWMRLDVWTGGEIAQVHPDQRIEFLPGAKYAGPVEKNWLQVRAPYLNCDFTLGHTMPYFTQKGRKWATGKAGDMVGRNAFDVPISGLLVGDGAITPEQMRVLVMVQADGSFETDTSTGRRMCIFVKKPRKIERARHLLAAAGVPFCEQTYPSHPGFVRFIVRHADYPAWMTPERKRFGPWLLDSTAEARAAFLGEVEHWDGYRDHANCAHYSTSERSNAEWAVTMAHLSNKGASIHTAPASGRRRENYTVAFRDRSFTRIKKGNKRLIEAPTPTFCASTQTGFWLARVGDRIFVTGNTGRWGGNNKMNMQNLTRGGELRKSVLAADGHVICVADSGQIEARVNGWLWGQHDLMDAFRASDTWDKARGVARGDDRDAYCKFGDLVYGREITTEDKTERFVGKVCVLGLGFQMGAPKLQMTLAKGALGGPPVFFTLDQCQRIINAYRRKNNKIASGWEICKGIIEDMAMGRSGSHGPISWEANTIWLPNGMALKYPDLKKRLNDKGWDEWTYQSGDQRKKIYGGLLCENIVQALARIIVAKQMLMIDQKHRVVLTTHDEAGTHVKAKLGPAATASMLKIMKTPLDWCKDIPLNAEGDFDVCYSK